MGGFLAGSVFDQFIGFNNMLSKITYYIKQVYGVDTLYISDAAVALQISRLTGKKTINHDDLNALATLGHEVERVPYPPTV